MFCSIGVNFSSQHAIPKLLAERQQAASGKPQPEKPAQDPGLRLAVVVEVDLPGEFLDRGDLGDEPEEFEVAIEMAGLEAQEPRHQETGVRIGTTLPDVKAERLTADPAGSAIQVAESRFGRVSRRVHWLTKPHSPPRDKYDRCVKKKPGGR
jgi:hypothetical protein